MLLQFAVQSTYVLATWDFLVARQSSSLVKVLEPATVIAFP